MVTPRASPEALTATDPLEFALCHRGENEVRVKFVALVEDSAYLGARRDEEGFTPVRKGGSPSRALSRAEAIAKPVVQPASKLNNREGEEDGTGR